MPADKLVIYLLRRDLRVADNPILHHLASNSTHGFSHLLPVFVFPPQQIEVSGFLKDGAKSPFPPAVSSVGKFWRCGPHRAKFLAESVWDLKQSLESLNSSLVIRVGEHADIVQRIVDNFKTTNTPVGAVWMTEECSSEEIQEQKGVETVCKASGVDFKLWSDEKYFIDDSDTGLKSATDLPDIFTTYRKSQEPLRERPRACLSSLTTALPQIPESSSIPPQHEPFLAASSLDDLQTRLCQPLKYDLEVTPSFPDGAESAHPLDGGETAALKRLVHLIKSGAMSSYANTRNGLLGLDFSTKLSAYLAFGCLTARQVHAGLMAFEDGTDTTYEQTPDYGKGENEGTKSVRFELLWRDYMRLCTKKFGYKLFKLSGFRQDASYDKKWKTPDKLAAETGQEPPPDEILRILKRFLSGTTGMGIIDASQRELFLTGYTSNRARQNVASFFSKHLQIDWRYGAEWYESLLIDYDVSSNWANWQYVAGVGNDPRGDARIFNPVKQAFDYDKEGTYVRTWVPEVKDFENVEHVFQAWTANAEELERLSLTNSILVTDPLKRIEFSVDRKPRGNRRPYVRGRGRGSIRGGMMQAQVLGFPPRNQVPRMIPMIPMPAPQPMYAPMHYEAPPPYGWNPAAGLPPPQWGNVPIAPSTEWVAGPWYGDASMQNHGHRGGGGYRGRGGYNPRGQ